MERKNERREKINATENIKKNGMSRKDKKGRWVEEKKRGGSKRAGRMGEGIKDGRDVRSSGRNWNGHHRPADQRTHRRESHQATKEGEKGRLNEEEE